MVPCRQTGTVSRGDIGTASCGGLAMVSCGILGVLTALVFFRVGRFAFEVFEPIRGVSRGWNDESLALLQCSYSILGNDRHRSCTVCLSRVFVVGPEETYFGYLVVACV